MNKVNFAFIPARGGSVGIKNKNIQKVGGVSLVERAYNHAFSSKLFEKIIISTDSYLILKKLTGKITLSSFNKIPQNEIIYISSKLVFHKRPDYQAETLSPIRDVIYSISNKFEFDYLWMLQPTTPFRKLNEFNELEILKKTLEDKDCDWSSIVSCKYVDGQHPDRMFRLKGNYVNPFIKQSRGENAPRQTLEKLLIKDGGFYIFKKTEITKNSFLGDKIIPYFRNGIITINIDSKEDLILARAMVHNKW